MCLRRMSLVLVYNVNQKTHKSVGPDMGLPTRHR